MPPSLRDTSSTLSGVDERIIHGESNWRHGSCRSSEGVDGNNHRRRIRMCRQSSCAMGHFAIWRRWRRGSWGVGTGNAIRLLTPAWSTDVARDFLAARCPKIVAQDSADEIIHDYSSLKSGLAFAGELTKGQTRKIGWIMSPLMEYQIADLDNASVTNSRLSSGTHQTKKFPPVWPVDKHVTWS